MSALPKLSIIVIFYNMRREAARTLHSLSAAYQTGVSTQDYEVIAIDNASSAPLNAAEVVSFGENFRYHFHATASISPAEAMNLGAKMAQGETLAFIVDGARVATPGLIAASLKALRLAPQVFVSALSWHLGPGVQNDTMLEGYDQTVEDGLFDDILWPEDGYRLFDISTLAPSSRPGFFGGVPSECSWLALPRIVFDVLGGYDERFQTGGGGLINHDFRNRAVTYPGMALVSLIGEGLFHQFHGGVATNVTPDHHPLRAFRAEYRDIHGREYTPVPCPDVTYLGSLPDPALKFVRQ